MVYLPRSWFHRKASGVLSGDMATEELPISVRYWPKDEGLNLGGNSQNDSALKKQQRQQEKGSARCTQMTTLKIALPIIVVMLCAAPAITVFVVRHVDKLSEYHHETTELFDVSELSTMQFKNGYVTLSWQRPQGRFDYYSIEAIENGSSTVHRHKLGLCANGTIIHPDQTQLTCGPYEQCTTLSYAMRTHLNGPQERSSPGVQVKDIFIPPEEPNPPTNLTMIPKSKSHTLLHWDYTNKVAAVLLLYSVKICRSFTTCGEVDSLSNCREHVTSESSIIFDSAEDTVYCVLVTSKARCGTDEMSSRAAVAELRTPIMVPPDVTNLHLVRIGTNDFTIAWTKPKFSFNYYWIDVTGVKNAGTRATPGTTGSCVNGTIIHPDWTQVTCSQLQPCSNVSVQVRSHISGPPPRTSHGVSHNILIPALVPPEVTNLTLGAVDEDTFVLNWQRPDACFDYYTVEVIDESTYKRSTVTCNNGTLIDPSRTSVICDQIKTCANVTIRVKTHTWGPPERASIGAVLKHVFLLGKAPPEPTNMKLVSAEGGNFTVKFKVQRECFDDRYSYKVVASKSNSSMLTADKCVFYILVYNQRTLTYLHWNSNL